MTKFEKKTIKIITAICKDLGCNSCPINSLDKCRVLDSEDMTCEDSVRMFYEEDEEKEKSNMAKIRVYEGYTDEQLLDAFESASKEVAEGGTLLKSILSRMKF